MQLKPRLLSEKVKQMLPRNNNKTDMIWCWRTLRLLQHTLSLQLSCLYFYFLTKAKFCPVCLTGQAEKRAEEPKEKGKTCKQLSYSEVVYVLFDHVFCSLNCSKEEKNKIIQQVG